MSVIEHLAVELTLEGAKFTTELSRALSLTEKMSNQFTVNFSRMAKELEHVGKIAAGVGIALGAAVATGIGAMAVQAFEAGDKLNKMADRLGVSVEWLQKMDWVARQTGTSLETVTSSFRFLGRAMVEAEDPASKQAILFKQLGLSLSDLKNMKQEDMFTAVADALSKVGDQSQRTTAMMTLFGRGAAEMGLLIKGGAEKMEELKKQINDTGTVLGKQDYNKLEAAADALELMEQYGKGVAKVIGAELSPVVVQLVNDFTKNENAIDNVRDAMKWLVDNTLKGLAVMIDTVHIFGIAWAFVKASVASLSVVIYELKDSFSWIFGWVGERAGMFGDALQAEFNKWAATFEMLWVGLKGVVQLTMNGVTAIVGAALVLIGQALDYLPGSVGKSVENAGRRMVAGTSASTEQVVADNKAAALKVADAWTVAADKLNAVISDPGRMPDMASGYKSEANKTARMLETEAWDMFNDALNKPFSGQSIIEWGERARKNLNDSTVPSDAKKKAPNDIEIDTGVDRRAKILENLRKQTDSERELEMQAYNERRAALAELQQSDFDGEEERMRLREQIEQRHNEKMLAITDSAAAEQSKLWKSGFQGKMSIASQYLGNIATLMNSKNKEMFEIGKVAAYAQTIVNTAQAAMSSFRFGSEIGGPILGAAFAATAIAAGIVQLQTIQSASFSGGGSVSSGGGGGPSGAPMPGELNNTGIPSMQSITPQQINISIEGEFVSRDAVLKLIDQINEARKDGATIRAA